MTGLHKYLEERILTLHEEGLSDRKIHNKLSHLNVSLSLIDDTIRDATGICPVPRRDVPCVQLY